MARRLFHFAFLIGLLIACQPKPKLAELVKDMVVETSYDNTVDFSGYATYILPLDTLGKISNTDPTDTLILGDYANKVSREVKRRLDIAGYSLVNKTQNPDLGVAIFLVDDYEVFQ